MEEEYAIVTLAPWSSDQFSHSPLALWDYRFLIRVSIIPALPGNPADHVRCGGAEGGGQVRYRTVTWKEGFRLGVNDAWSVLFLTSLFWQIQEIEKTS